MVALFILLFTIHEVEEVIRLPKWAKHYRKALTALLPQAIQPVLHISPKGFALIALWEGLIVLGVSFLLPGSIWWFGMVAAYTLHLLIHVGQYVALRKNGLACPKLYSVPIELPICFYILDSHITIAPPAHLIWATLLFSAIAAINLVSAHRLIAKLGI